MKRFVCVLLCTILVTLELTTDSVQAWSRKYHNELVEVNIKYAGLTPPEKELALRCATLADEGIYSGGRLHGTGNYIKSLELVYTCAYNLRNNVKDPLYSAFDTTYKEAGYQKLYNKIYLLTIEQVIPNADESTNEAKAAKVLGFACHLAGDIYAHRTIVPVEADREVFEKHWKNWVNGQKKMSEEKAQELPEFTDLFGSYLDKYGEGRRLIIEGKANFLDLQSFNHNRYRAVKYRRFIGLVYEDNPAFFKERYDNGAMELVKNMLTLYGENKPFNKATIFKTSCSIPLQKAE